MKLIQICTAYKPAFMYGGTVTAVAKICESIQADFPKQVVYTTDAYGQANLQVPLATPLFVHGVSVVYYHRNTKGNSNISMALWKALLAQKKSKVLVHIHGWWNLVLIGAAVICRLKGIQFVFTPHGMLSPYSFINSNRLVKKILQKTIGNWALKNAVIHVTSQKEQGDMQAIFPEKKRIIFNIPNIPELVDTPATPYFLEDSGKCLRLLFFSRIDPKKGLNFLLEALNEANFSFVLNIYGDGEAQYIDSLKAIIKPDNKNHIHWKGAVYGNQKFEVFANHHSLVLPSYDENFALIVLESLCMGTAVVLTQKVGLADYVMQNNFGWICTQEAQNILKVLKEVSSNAEKLRAIHQQAPAKVKSHFDADLLKNEYKKMYEIIMQKQAKNPAS